MDITVLSSNSQKWRSLIILWINTAKVGLQRVEFQIDDHKIPHRYEIDRK